MRVRIRNNVILCKRITHNDGSDLLFITTIDNQNYTVDCKHEQIALTLYDKVLVAGWIDVSEFEYIN